MSDILVGKRAVYTRVSHRWDDALAKSVETDRKLFHGTIGAVLAVGGSACVVMLYDDGSLRTHAIENVTVEGASPEGAL